MIIISFCILFLGEYNEYIYYLTEKLLTYRLKGFNFTLIAFFFLIYSLKVKNNVLNIISYIAVLSVFICTFYILITIITSNKFEHYGINFGIGFYIHILSFIIFLLVFF